MPGTRRRAVRAGQTASTGRTVSTVRAASTVRTAFATFTASTAMTALTALTVVLLCSSGATAGVKSFKVRGVSLAKEVILPGTPEEIFDAFTGDVSPWWDHHISEHPLRLVIETEPGGAFREVFDKDGNGAIHATVITVERGKLLRLQGPFGFAGAALDMVHTFRFEAMDGHRTKLTLELNAVGQIDDDGVSALDGVWDHFLAGQFQAWVKAGMPGR